MTILTGLLALCATGCATSFLEWFDENTTYIIEERHGNRYVSSLREVRKAERAAASKAQAAQIEAAEGDASTAQMSPQPERPAFLRTPARHSNALKDRLRSSS